MPQRLDPEKRYGIWWFNRRRTKTYQEAVDGPDGRRYKKRAKITPRPEEEWIAVPVPDSGISREWVDLAREAIKGNARYSRNNNRPWTLSGGLARCAECGWAMATHSVWGRKVKHVNHYYRCSKAHVGYAHNRVLAQESPPGGQAGADGLGLRLGGHEEPRGTRADLDRMIEHERAGTRGNPDKEAKLWAERLVEVDRKRAKYQEAFAADAVTLPELKAYLAQLDETRKTAEHELEALRGARSSAGARGGSRHPPRLVGGAGPEGARFPDARAAPPVVQAAQIEGGRVRRRKDRSQLGRCAERQGGL